MKRFYRTVDIAEDGGAFVVRLDGKPVKTPARKALTAPNRALAEAVVAEWQSQAETVDPAGMPYTRMLSVITDQDEKARESLIERLVSYGRNDLLCYRADKPDDLVRRQGEIWDPYLDWLAEHYGVRLQVTSGIVPVRQPEQAIDTLSGIVAAFDDGRLTVLSQMAHLTGSLVLALALAEEATDAGSAWRAATVDEQFQAEHWGVDDEAAERRRAMRRELDEALAFWRLL